MKTIHPPRMSKMSAEEQALVARRIVEANSQYPLDYEHSLKGRSRTGVGMITRSAGATTSSDGA